MKSAVRALARRLGFEIRSLRGLPPEVVLPWTITTTEPLRDEATPGLWLSNALNIATHKHRPTPLAYRRPQSGEDPRIKHAAFFLDVRDLRVLELGPFEGCWSVLLEKWGAREVVTVESRPENLARCERIKALHHLDRTRNVLGDIEHLADGRATLDLGGPFDLVFCLGLLYHLPDPARVLRWCRSQAPRLFLGTHYVEPAEAGRYLAANFTEATHRFEGQVYHGKDYREGGRADPLSGMSPTSFWPNQADLLAMIRQADFAQVHILGRDLVNRMPHITILAEA